ncbi:head GIN domain-containing protein [Massilia sp. W12]|uniref:head GIN domain-containing protein n=1 Tax=Massilia sp. W12 TaxID=3126507 RepID=UPI0030CE8671
MEQDRLPAPQDGAHDKQSAEFKEPAAADHSAAQPQQPPKQNAMGKLKRLPLYLKIGLGLVLSSMVLTASMAGLMQAHGGVKIQAKSLAPLTQNHRSLTANISRVEINLPYDIEIEQSETAGMDLEGEASVLAQISATVEGDLLKIELLQDKKVRGEIRKIRLKMPQLSHVEHQGSGTLEIRGFHGDSLEMQMRGSGEIDFKGQYKNLTGALRGSGDMRLDIGSAEKVSLSLTGSGGIDAKGSAQQLHTKLSGHGDLNAEHLSAHEVQAELNGNGDMHVNARQSLQLNLHGNGDVMVAGKPAVRHVTVRGLGDVHFD